MDQGIAEEILTEGRIENKHLPHLEVQV